MLKSTILSTVAFMFLFVVWAITPVQAHIGDPCPHKNQTHEHCQNVINDLMIVDSSDPPKQVGAAGVFIDGRPVFSHDGQIFTLHIGRTGVFSRDTLVFESSDCGVSGGDDAFKSVPAFLRSEAVINSPGNTLYLEKPDSVDNRIILSMRREDGTCFVFPASVPTDTVIMDPLVDLDTIFTPPFTYIAGDTPSLPLP